MRKQCRLEGCATFQALKSPPRASAQVALDQLIELDGALFVPAGSPADFDDRLAAVDFGDAHMNFFVLGGAGVKLALIGQQLAAFDLEQVELAKRLLGGGIGGRGGRVHHHAEFVELVNCRGFSGGVEVDRAAPGEGEHGTGSEQSGTQECKAGGLHTNAG
jgi:hypothetical protein